MMIVAFLEKLGDSGPTLAVVAAMAVFCWVLLRRSHRRLGRWPKDQPTLVRTPRPEDESHDSDAPLPDDLVRWEVQMHETARNLSAQLDSKMSALESLIRDADRAAARLEAARSGVEPTIDPARSAENYRAQITQLADYGFSAADIASRLLLPGDEVIRILNERDDTP